MWSRSSGEGDNAASQLGGARADFIASLGRKVRDARELLAGLEDDPSSRQARDELRRRLHALGAGARLLHFEAMFRSLQEALGVLDRGAHVGSLREQEVAFVAQVVDDLPALAWGEAPPVRQARDRGSERGRRDEPPEAPATAADEAPEAPGAPGVMPIAVLVVGDEALADALGEDGALQSRAFESERTTDPQTALELARAYAPDMMLIDADVPQTAELVEALLEDPLTESVPIVVVGTFATGDAAARFVALGVTMALPKPIPPGALAQACDEILDARQGRALRVTLGEPTLVELADRLSEELKRALTDGVDRAARSCHVPLGEGTEVLGALWGAIARVQAIVTQKTEGAVRFRGGAPEGTIALAPWLHHDLPGSDRLGRARGAADDVSLRGRRVVVADDDPGVTWFISDLLRTAGCEVHEALDGTMALELAYRFQPELIVSDILMPGMDGFALSRALRRDVALRDVPVILLSWKEDLLQRVRELGASAAAYMRKESDARSILARVREVLRPRARVEMRLRGDGEVRGRLDGLTARLLLELVGELRQDARVVVRDATYLYEIEIRGGVPRKATRMASDGGYLRGDRVLASLLGVGSARFVVSRSAEPIRGELTGALFDQLARPIAAARGAVAVTTGARAVHVERIALDQASLDDYLHATPDPARAMIRRLMAGASPRQMLLAGEVAPTLLEDVLVDLASRGAIRAVEGSNGEDLLTPATEAALTVLRGTPVSVRSRPPGTRSSMPAAPAATHRRVEPPFPHVAEESTSSPDLLGKRSVAPSSPLPERLPAPPGEGAPSSLEDAVMREISDRSPDPGTVHVPPSDPPPLIEPSALRKRSSNPPPQDEGTLEAVEEWVPLASLPPEATTDSAEEWVPFASLPPDAMVPDTSTNEEPFLAAPSAPWSVAAPRRLSAPAPEELEPLSDPDASAEPDPEWAPGAEVEPPDSVADAETAPDTEVEAVYSSPFAVTTPIVPPLWAPPAPTFEATSPLLPTDPPHREAPVQQAAAPRSPWPFLAAIAVLSLAVVGSVVGLKSGETDKASAPTVSAATIPKSALRTASTAEAPTTAAATGSAPEDDLPPGAETPAGLGRIDVSAPAGARVRIDGAIAGLGPMTSLVAAPGPHEVRVEVEGGDTKEVIEVHAGKTTRVRSAPPP